jgi:hypothetical protein
VASNGIVYIQGRGGRSRIHSKKILIQSWPPTNIIPVTAMLDRVNMALAMRLCQLRTKPATKNSSALIVSAEALAAAARNKKKNRRGSRQYRMARKFLFMRCICI